MRQAANVISFPHDLGTTDLLRDFLGNPTQRLDEIVARLTGIGSLLFLIRQAEDHISVPMASALLGIEAAVHDCVRIAELKPLA